MTEKRFENRLDKSNVKFNTLNPVWDNEKEDALNVFEMIDLLNELYEENEQLKGVIGKSVIERLLDGFEESYKDLEKENEQLKSKNRGLQSELQIFKEDVTHSNLQINKLADVNEQLKQRNDRQAKQLDRLYRLIEEKDWRALTDILDDFKRCDEQLQREWGKYGDVE